MRLTLRNMLASMDEILEPAQQEEIKQKIDESEFATGIMHRIRDVTRRIRLGAPKLTGKGMGLDPNTVAMYLDNTLSADRVPDFEKVCLESDVHLAEVAACHQVLSLVLGEPAEVDPGLRRRLYEIDPAHAPSDSDAAATKVPPPLPPSALEPRPRRRPRVPEYLREDRRSRWWAVAATLLLALLLGGAVIRALGPFDRTNPALAWLPIGGDEVVTQNDGNGADGQRSPGRKAGVNGAADEGAAPGDANSDQTPQNGAADEANGVNAKGAALSDPIDQRGRSIPPDGPQLPAGDDAKAPLPPLPDEDDTKRPVPGDEARVAPVDPQAAVPTDTGETPAEDAVPAVEQPTQENGAARRADPIGRFVADPNVLLRLNRDGEWQRVPQGATLRAGERLLVLPTYRPSISLSAGLTVQVLGETLVELLPPDSNGVPGLRIPYGRVVVMSVGKPNVSLHLSLPGADGTATFVDADATLAAEVRRFLPAGANPEEERAYVSIDFYVPSGEIDWRLSANPDAQRIRGPSRFAIGVPYPLASPDEAELPAWIAAEKLSGVDELATVDLNRALSETNDRPVALVLRELADHPRRWELNYLGARSLALVGEFDPLVKTFQDSDQRAVWLRQFETLQAALARGPETAAKVRQAFERQRGENGKQLYRMLWGYSKADIQSGAAAQLVEYLDHPSALDFRVLAYYALRSVPGVPPDYAGYRPESPPASRQRAVQQWRRLLNTGPLSPKGALDRPGPAPAEHGS